ncbi:MAG: DUF4286 family protein [Bacteroidia bacterium]|mgnify:FL=1|jgi:hypothetical protein
MIVYNVTCNVGSHMAEEWLKWMQEEHIPEVMQTGCFTECKILKLLTEADDNEGINYAIQYTANTIDNYNQYKDQFGPILQAKTKEKYGDSVLAYRSLLEVIM